MWTFPAWVIICVRQHVCVCTCECMQGCGCVCAYLQRCLNMCVWVTACMGCRCDSACACCAWVWLQWCAVFHTSLELLMGRWWVPCVSQVLLYMHLCNQLCAPAYVPTFVQVFESACTYMCMQCRVWATCALGCRWVLPCVPVLVMCVLFQKCVCTHLGACAWWELKVKIGKWTSIVYIILL